MDFKLDVPGIDMVNMDMDTSMALFTFWGIRVLSAVLILIAGWVIGNYARRAITSIRKLDETLKFFLGGLAKYTILIISIITILGQFGVQTASLIAVLGAAGLAIGLAMQGTLSNVAAGVMLLILRPFNVGNYIEAGGIGGVVRELGLFTTELATPEGIYIFVPNSLLWDADIKNFNRYPDRRQDILVGISYGDDIDKAFAIIKEVLDNEQRLVRGAGKDPVVLVNAMGASSVDLIVRVWSHNNDFWDAKWDLTKAIKEALDAGGITIPFPTRTIITVDNNKSKDDKKAA